MNNLIDKIKYVVWDVDADGLIYLDMYLLGEELGWIKYHKTTNRLFMGHIQVDKAPYFSISVEEFRELADNYLREKGYPI